jgi:hypothetical protein
MGWFPTQRGVGHGRSLINFEAAKWLQEHCSAIE